MLKKKTQSIHYQAVFQWFFRIFITVSLIFCFSLIPLFASSQNIFTDLQKEKRKQMLHSGTTEISSTITGMLNTSSMLMSDERFIHLLYKNIDYTDFTITAQRQMRNTLNSLTSPFEAITNTTLLLDENVIITNNSIFFEYSLPYYPNFFQVDNLSYEEWVNLLASTGTGFTPACNIATYRTSYDALTYVIPWSNGSYLYSCIPVETIKELVIEEANLSNCYFTITSAKGDILYSDLPEDTLNYQTFTEGCSTGRIKISVHIPDSIFFQDMKTFYVFFVLYIIVCIMALISMGIVGTKRATKPVMNIIDLLEQSRNIKPIDSITSQQNNSSGFDYISNSIKNADHNLEMYQTALNTQQKILQARFIEKAIGGQLVSKNDIRDFCSYFPNFPNNFRLLLVKLWAYTDKSSTTTYQDPLLLLQSFLENKLSCVYQQPINDTELLLILSEENYNNSQSTLNFIINNINQEEPTYHAGCIASDIYHNLEEIPTAYQQLRALDSAFYTENRTQICTASDSIMESELKIPITMIDLMTLYTAITSGNIELALNRLSSYSDELARPENVTFTVPVYEVIKSMLTYIKIDYWALLINQYIPSYQNGKTLYEQLCETIQSFCGQINEYNHMDKDSFTLELFNYIDDHYTDCDICLTSLKTHFKCSESTIRKVFKRVTDVPIARYIEQKRMLLANDLLAQNEMSVTEIARLCGYSLPHSFYKAYKRVYGHAPTLQNGTNTD